MLYFNGKIYTGAEQPFASCIICRGNRIIFCGEDEQARQIAPSEERFDLQGRTVLPGLIDAHAHIIAGGQSLFQVDLRGAASKEQFIETVRQYAAGMPPGAWILGGNWDHERWGGALPDKSWIDAVTPNNPLYLHRIDMHMGLANSAALAAAGITSRTVCPDGGMIVMDADGNPAGILKDTAAFMLLDRLPAVTADEYRAYLEAALKHAAANGITGMQDATSDLPDVSGLYAAAKILQTRNELTARIAVRTAPADYRVIAALSDKHGAADEQVYFCGCKAFMDGSIGSTTACFFEPYTDDRSTCGLALNDWDELEHNLTLADAAGQQISVHAIGDKANSRLLDIFENILAKNGPRERRWRIEHAQHLCEQDFVRYKRLGVIASVQPYHVADDGCWADKRIGSKRSQFTYAFKSFLDNGVPLAFGTDWTVAPLNPFLTIQAAVTRQTLDGRNPNGWVPAQKIGLTRAIDAYTCGSAYAVFQENNTGRIAPGYFADFIVLDKDIFSVAADDIHAVRVDMTVFDGKIVYER